MLRVNTPLLLVWGGSLVCLLLLGGCEFLSCGTDKIATLADAKGKVERDTASEINQWKAAERGAAFREGDAIRTRKDAVAALSFSGGGTIALEENTLIRFTRKGQGAGVDIAMGSATVHAVGNGLVFATQQGEGQLEQGAKALIRATGEGLVYEMLSGSGLFFDKRGQSRTLAVSQRLVFNTQGQIIEEVDAGIASEAGLEPTDGGVEAGIDAGDLAGRISVIAGRVRYECARWKTLRDGEDASWDAGTEVQVLRDGQARVARGGQTAELQGSGKHRASEDGFLRVTDGRVLLSGASETTALFAGGSVTSAPGARTLVVASRRGTRITVTKGSASVRHADESTDMAAGDTLALTRAGSVDEAQPVPPKRAHFFMGVGDSVTVHDARSPTHIGFRFGDKCPNGGVVTVKHGAREYMTSAGQSAANVAMPPGRNRYEIKCANGAEVASGTVTVMRDSGRTALPRSAPPTLVDTDGRNYRVLYQNLLPEVTVRWRNAPAGPYQLTVTTNGKTETFKSSAASYKFDSGALREGEHRLVFSAAERKSKPTSLFIRFDNAAPKARISAPSNGSFAAGQTVQVSGVALKGWKASVAGKELSMDGQARFTGEVQVPADQDGIVVRLDQPGRGAHYYLRRAK